MLLLVSGSSGSGKTTLCTLAAGRVQGLAFHELGEIARPWQGNGPWWRRDLTERWLARALEYEADGVDLLLTEGVIGEVLAAPSATLVGGIAACLLDCADDERLLRLRGRAPGEEIERKQLWDFFAWATWLRFHAADPQCWDGPIRGDGDTTWHWSRWEAWPAGDPRWSVFRLDTTGETVARSAERLAGWIEDQRRLRDAGRLPLSTGWADA